MTASQLDTCYLSAQSNPASAALLYLLPPCLAYLAFDVASRYSSQQPMPVDATCGAKLDALEEQMPRILDGLKGIDQRIQGESRSSQYLIRELARKRNFAHHRRQLREFRTHSRSVSSPPSDDAKRTEISEPFSNFCEKLLLQNRIWKQQKEIKVLQQSLGEVKDSNASNAFKSFCDRLLLSNSVWKAQKEVTRLTAETEKLKRSRVAAVTRAAKQMVHDVRKERMTEDFVKDLISELEQCKQAMTSLKADHEKEIEVLAQAWRSDYLRLSKEVDRLQLAQEARRLEQDLSNQVERELLERIAQDTSAEDLKGERFMEERSAYPEDDMETLSYDSDDRMSNLSTSTYVGSSGQCSPNLKFAFDDETTPTPSPKFRRRSQSSTSLRISLLSTKTPTRKLDPAPYAGFSFNPIFFGNGSEDIAPQDADRKVYTAPPNVYTFSLKPPPTRRRTVSLASTSSSISQRPTAPPKRVQWRI